MYEYMRDVHSIEIKHDACTFRAGDEITSFTVPKHMAASRCNVCNVRIHEGVHNIDAHSCSFRVAGHKVGSSRPICIG